MEHGIVFTPKPKREAHWRKLTNHLKFDVFANSAFVFNTLSLKRYKFQAFLLTRCAFYARFDGIMTSLWCYDTRLVSMISTVVSDPALRTVLLNQKHVSNSFSYKKEIVSYSRALRWSRKIRHATHAT